MLTAKVGPISDNLYHSAIYEAQHDIRAHKQIAPTWKFRQLEQDKEAGIHSNEQLLRIICKFDLMEGIVNEKV